MNNWMIRKTLCHALYVTKATMQYVQMLKERLVYMCTECSGIILQMSQIKLEVTNLKQILNNQTTDFYEEA